MALEQLPIWDRVSQLGFLDVGAYFPGLCGRSPDNTYRGISRLDYCIANASAVPFLDEFTVDPRGYTDHASLHITLNISRPSLNKTIWSMPMDIAAIKPVVKNLPSQDVPLEVLQDFAVQLNDGFIDNAYHLFCRTFEDLCDNCHVDAGLGALPCKFRGRGRGKLVKAPRPSYALSQHGTVLSDQIQFRKRQKAMRQFRELKFLLRKTAGAWCAEHERLWNFLLRSRAFPHGFANWLLSNDICAFVPQRPSLEWVCEISEALQIEEECWAHAVKSRQQQLFKRFRDSDWKDAGATWHASVLKPPKAASLTTMCSKEVLQIRHARSCKGHPATFNVLHGSLPGPGAIWNFGSVSARVTAVAGSIVSLDIPLRSGMATGTVTQIIPNNEPQFIAETVQKYWDQFWNTSSQPNMEFVNRNLQNVPELPPFDPRITVQELHVALRKLPRRKARGMDGWSNGELASLSPDMASMLLALLNKITDSAVWPGDLCQSTVNLLAKVLSPTEASQARPITILAVIFRLWSKCMAAKVLKHLLPYVPQEIFGSIPNRCAHDLAFDLQSSIEEGLLTNTAVCGSSIDLVKAYNLISRPVLMVIAERLGWPVQLRMAYSSFLCSLQRFFSVDGSLFGPCASSVGVPEGCPLAVTSMIAITWFVGGFLKTNMGLNLSSYVDNWSVQSSDPSLVLQATQSIWHATDQLAMQISSDKLRFFSTNAAQRKFLRQQRLQDKEVMVSLDFRDLGVYFNSAARCSAKGFNSRFQANQGRFQKLATVSWSESRKASSLVRFIFPAVLYDAPLTHVSGSNFRQLRGRCTSALFGKRNQRDHFLAPLLSSSQIYEPFLQVFKIRWRTVQRMLRRSPAVYQRRWNTVFEKYTGKPLGPLGYFFEQVYKLHWVVQLDGIIVDHNGLPWNVATIPWKMLERHVWEAWIQCIIPLIRIDPQFAGIRAFDLSFIRKAYSSTEGYNGLVANYSTGAILSSKAKAKFLDGSAALCSLCQKDGDAAHVLWECTGTQNIREKMDLALLGEQVPAIKVAGLFPQLDGHADFLQNLLAIPEVQHIPFIAEEVIFFTDGSTDWGNHSPLTLSSWSVVRAYWGSSFSQCVAKGPLPGPCQSNNRAELYAVVQAVRGGQRGSIYTDSAIVVKGFQRLQKAGWDETVWSKADNYDLWLQLHQALLPDPLRWKIIWIPSHRAIQEAKSESEAWEILHNDTADRFAKAANKGRSPGFLEMHRNMVWQFKQFLQLQQTLLQLQQQVSVASKLEKFLTVPAESSFEPDRWRITLERFGMLINEKHQRIPAFQQELNLTGFIMYRPFVSKVWDFLRSQCWVPDPSGCSFCELFAAFFFECGWPVPVNITKIPSKHRPHFLQAKDNTVVWSHEFEWEQLALQRPSLTEQTVIFRNIVVGIFRSLQVPWESVQRQSLWTLSSRSFASLKWRPVNTCNGFVLRKLLGLQSGVSFATFMRTPLSANRPISIVGALAIRNVEHEWAEYKSVHRQRHQ